MSTQLFILDASSDWSSGNNDAKFDGTASGWINNSLGLSRGSGVVQLSQNTVAGPTNGIEVSGGLGQPPRAYISPPLDADVTISGSITWNLWAEESNMAANVAINGILEVIDGATGAVTLIDKTARVTEVVVGVGARTVNNFAETPAAGVACKRGDRLRVRIFGDDAGTMASGNTFDFGYGGLTTGLDGDSYLTLTENLTFVSEPAGSQVFLTDTASDVATASVDREVWTSRGSGVQTDVRNTAAGWTAPLQMTDTAGGTVVDWFTKPLAAFTLGGAVRCNIRGLESAAAANAAFRVEIDVVDNDGTNPVDWGVTTTTEVSISEIAHSFLVSGDDLAVTNGQRLRIRILIDDANDFAMTSARTVTLYYAGTSGGASGDTFLTFTQTLTEYIATVDPVIFTERMQALIAQ